MRSGTGRSEQKGAGGQQSAVARGPQQSEDSRVVSNLPTFKTRHTRRVLVAAAKVTVGLQKSFAAFFLLESHCGARVRPDRLLTQRSRSSPQVHTPVPLPKAEEAWPRVLCAPELLIPLVGDPGSLARPAQQGEEGSCVVFALLVRGCEALRKPRARKPCCSQHS